MSSDATTETWWAVRIPDEPLSKGMSFSTDNRIPYEITATQAAEYRQVLIARGEPDGGLLCRDHEGPFILSPPEVQ